MIFGSVPKEKPFFWMLTGDAVARYMVAVYDAQLDSTELSPSAYRALPLAPGYAVPLIILTNETVK